MKISFEKSLKNVKEYNTFKMQEASAVTAHLKTYTGIAIENLCITLYFSFSNGFPAAF